MNPSIRKAALKDFVPVLGIPQHIIFMVIDHKIYLYCWKDKKRPKQIAAMLVLWFDVNLIDLFLLQYRKLNLKLWFPTVEDFLPGEEFPLYN